MRQLAGESVRGKGKAPASKRKRKAAGPARRRRPAASGAAEPAAEVRSIIVDAFMRRLRS